MKYFKDGLEFNKFTDKETLKYCLGGLLYSPATNLELKDKILDGSLTEKTSSIAICLEDACAEGMRELAENNIKDILQTLQEEREIINLPLIFIRVKEPKQIWRLYNKCKDSLNVITGFIFPKFDSGNALSYIEQFKRVKRNLETPLYFMPIIESRKAIYVQDRVENLLRIKEILDNEEDVLNVRVGAADFSSIYNIRRDKKVSIWSIKVVEDALTNIINIFSRDYVISGGVYEYFGKQGEEWEEYFRHEIQLDIQNSMVGKTCIHPYQVPVLIDELKVDKEKYEDAKLIIESDISNCAVKKGVSNSMLEIRVHKNWAEKILKLAKIYGVRKEN